MLWLHDWKFPKMKKRHMTHELQVKQGDSLWGESHENISRSHFTPKSTEKKKSYFAQNKCIIIYSNEFIFRTFIYFCNIHLFI